jgi:hypothetical protein
MLKRKHNSYTGRIKVAVIDSGIDAHMQILK